MSEGELLFDRDDDLFTPFADDREGASFTAHLTSGHISTLRSLVGSVWFAELAVTETGTFRLCGRSFDHHLGILAEIPLADDELDVTTPGWVGTTTPGLGHLLDLVDVHSGDSATLDVTPDRFQLLDDPSDGIGGTITTDTRVKSQKGPSLSTLEFYDDGYAEASGIGQNTIEAFTKGESPTAMDLAEVYLGPDGFWLSVDEGGSTGIRAYEYDNAETRRRNVESARTWVKPDRLVSALHLTPGATHTLRWEDDGVLTIEGATEKVHAAVAVDSRQNYNDEEPLYQRRDQTVSPRQTESPESASSEEA